MRERSQSIHSILLCADRSSEAQVALRKASILARYLGVGIELFACDADHAWAVARAAEDPAARAELAACLAASRRYLAALRGSIAAADVQLTTRAACAATFAEGVAERVREGGHDLIMKNLADGLATDMALVQACQVPLLLTRSRPWRPAPCIWAALELDGRDVAAGQQVVAVAQMLSRACGGSFGLVNCRGTAAAQATSIRREEEAARALGVVPSALRVLEGDPRVTLPAALREAEVDLLVIAQARRAVRRPGEWSVTETLLGVDGCDVLVVPDPEARSVARVGRLGASFDEDASHRER